RLLSTAQTAPREQSSPSHPRLATTGAARPPAAVSLVGDAVVGRYPYAGACLIHARRLKRGARNNGARRVLHRARPVATFLRADPRHVDCRQRDHQQTHDRPITLHVSPPHPRRRGAAGIITSTSARLILLANI